MKRYQAVCALIVLALAGCGYTTKPLTPDNVRTIYVPIFDNRTFRRGLEFQLTQAVKTEILYKSDLRIASRASADTELIGEIVEVRENVLMEDLHDDIVETGVTITVDIVWRDRRTNRILLEHKDISDTAEFIVTRGESIGTATEEAFRDLAERIVSLLQEDW